jgi:hypothetical protein
MKTKHAPLPWWGTSAVIAKDGTLVAGSHIIKQTRLEKANHELIVRSVNALPDYKEAADKFNAFLDSLPEGWLGKTSGDIGLLNDAFLAYSRAIAKAEGR